jgi:N6-L-threonylcarbamoyladenine synthase
MVASLAVGLDTAKGLAVAYNVPLIGVHHMQAHALTPRLVSALRQAKEEKEGDHHPTPKPEFPFLTLLVSGGHTLLLRSAAMTSHTILAESIDIALGDMIDKASRSLVPAGILDAAKKLDGTVVYGAVLEDFCFPPAAATADYHYHPPGTNPRKTEDQRKLEKWGGDWKLGVPLASTPGAAFVGLDGTTESAKAFSFTGLGSAVERALGRNPDMTEEERRALGREVLVVAFEHLATRIAPALSQNPDIKTLVVSGGVASNKFLRHLLKRHIIHAGFPEVQLVAPPLKYCTDNAAMIAWAALEMFAEGYETDLSVMPIRRWSMDDNDPVEIEWEREEGKGGILGARGWTRKGT